MILDILKEIFRLSMHDVFWHIFRFYYKKRVKTHASFVDKMKEKLFVWLKNA
jgi:hypothetical protein